MQGAGAGGPATAVPQQPSQQAPGLALRYLVLVLAATSAVAVRSFAVLRYGVRLRDYEPFFNLRFTNHIIEHGVAETYDWYDTKTWYPLGRQVAGTTYPGLMLFTARAYQIIQLLGTGVSLETVCVFVPPALAVVTTALVYHLTAQITNARAGLVAACLVAVVPAYSSRTGAGAFNTDCIGIPCMLWAFYAWLKAIESGTMRSSLLAAVAYYSVVSSWDGYFFVLNLVALHVACLMVLGRYTPKVYIAYSIFYVFGTLFSFQVPSVSLLSVVSPQHAMGLAVFGERTPTRQHAGTPTHLQRTNTPACRSAVRLSRCFAARAWCTSPCVCARARASSLLLAHVPPVTRRHTQARARTHTLGRDTHVSPPLGALRWLRCVWPQPSARCWRWCSW